MEDIKPPIRFVSTLAAAPKAFRFKPKIATPAAAAAADATTATAIDEETVKILESVAKREAEARAKLEAEARAKREAEGLARRAEASRAECEMQNYMKHLMTFTKQEGEKKREGEDRQKLQEQQDQAAQKLQEQEAQRAKLLADAEEIRAIHARERARRYIPAPM